MNLINCTPLFRLSIRVFTIAVLMLLPVGCTLPQITPTIVPTVTAAPTHTATLTPTPSPTPTATNSPTPSSTPTATASPTITNTPLPTWTAYQVNMYFSPTERAAFDPKNPHHNCFITYFALTLQPGYIGVWRADNGGYNHCEALIKP